jgi:pyoverdine/dityrosine biosynthesis protein Dit1
MEIIDIFQKYRMEPTPIDQYESKGKEVLQNKIEYFMGNNMPIKFTMLGFPFKSPNHRDKTISDNADRSEKEALLTFDNLIREINEVYSYGVEINVASDGYVFNDLLGVDDSVVQLYKDQCLELSSNASFRILDMKDFYTSSLNVSRDKVMSQFGVTELDIQNKILFNPDTNYLYRGMIRFMTEELRVRDFVSNNQLHVAAKKLTRQMMLRNEAWSNLVKSELSDHIRLSIHPSVNDGSKFSFEMIKGAHHSPWHSVIAIDDSVKTMHKKDAEAQGYVLNHDHYIKS